MKRISDETLNKLVGWRLSGVKPLEFVDNDDVMNLIEDLRDARQQASKEAHVRNVWVGGALQATDALLAAERRAEAAEAELAKLQSERDEDLIAVAAEMTKDIDTDAVKRAIEADRRATKAEAEVERLNRVTVAYWARFGAVPEDGEQILGKARARIEQLERIAGDALNELSAALDGKPNPKAREFLGFLQDKLDAAPTTPTPPPARPEKTTCPHCRTLYRPGERHACAPGAIGCDCSPSTCHRVCRCICHSWNKL